MVTTGWYWHVHHDVLLEWCTDYDKRVSYIRRYKPGKERALRLRLFRPVQGDLPPDLVAAEAAYDKAGVARDKAWAAYYRAEAACDKAWAACDKAGVARKGELEALHAAECPGCPWNGQTIFPIRSEG